MNQEVRFIIALSGEDFCLRLVHPEVVRGDGSTVSILATAGSALHGVSQGDGIEWPKPGGGILKITMKEITYQPELAGEYHR